MPAPSDVSIARELTFPSLSRSFFAALARSQSVQDSIGQLKSKPASATADLRDGIPDPSLGSVCLPAALESQLDSTLVIDSGGVQVVTVDDVASPANRFAWGAILGAKSKW